jgi:hypothetical protein
MNAVDFASLVADFTGANQNPLSDGGKWAVVSSLGIPLQRTGNQVTSTGATTGESYWTPDLFGPDLAAYVTVATLPGSGDSARIYARGQQMGGANTWDGYSLRWQNQATPQLFIDRILNNGITNLATPNQALTAGDKIGIVLVGSMIESWVFRSGAWSMVSQVFDSTYPNAGSVALGCRNTTGRLDDFYCGTIQDVQASFV